MQQTIISTPMQYNVRAKSRAELPKSLFQAAGLMRHKKKSLEKHLKVVRREWRRKVSS